MLPHAVTAEDNQTEASLAKLDEEARKDIDRQVDNHVRRYISVNVYPHDLNENHEMIKESTIASQVGNESGFTQLNFIANLFTEAATQPRSREPPVPDKLYEKVVANVLSGRYTGDDPGNACLRPGDLVTILDGGKSGMQYCC